MVGGISGVSSYSTYYLNMNLYRNVNRTQGAGAQSRQAENAQRAGTTNAATAGWAVRKPSNLETPVQPVDAVKRVNQNAQPAGIDLPLSIRQGADPAEMAVRMRITPYVEDESAAELPALSGNAEDAGAAQLPGLSGNAEDAGAAQLPGLSGNAEGANPAQLGLLPGAEDAENAELLPGIDEEGNAQGPEAAQKALEEGQCQTCENRKYQDGSDDMSVSFQTPTNIKPEQVASAVRGHEMEHVIHEQAKAKLEDRKVVSQSVTLHTDICPECGKVYVSGGETRTTTKANPEEPTPEEQAGQNNQNGQKDQAKSFSVFG